MAAIVIAAITKAVAATSNLKLRFVSVLSHQQRYLPMDFQHSSNPEDQAENYMQIGHYFLARSQS